MQAEGGGAGRVAEHGAGQASLQGSGSQHGPGGHEDPGRGGSGEVGPSDSLATEIALALVTPELGADAWQRPDGHDEPTAASYLMVPFPSSMEADMASRLLLPHVQAQEGVGLKELTVSDNRLTVRLTGEDPFEIRSHITSCLDQLSLMAVPAVLPSLESGFRQKLPLYSGA
ncbi:cancer/testis antigen 1 [Pipistrellus kuhlii]|uniref:cancer/testis antigen 1 n=1 Tax=Pipistrellus kuhlii TaxID=59472 RepID=UPI00174EFC58|nr:cancer/testis antigen 1 [Pipistrellus kuhlii]